MFWLIDFVAGMVFYLNFVISINIKQGSPWFSLELCSAGHHLFIFQHLLMISSTTLYFHGSTL